MIPLAKEEDEPPLAKEEDELPLAEEEDELPPADEDEEPPEEPNLWLDDPDDPLLEPANLLPEEDPEEPKSRTSENPLM